MVLKVIETCIADSYVLTQASTVEAFFDYSVHLV